MMQHFTSSPPPEQEDFEFSSQLNLTMIMPSAIIFGLALLLLYLISDIQQPYLLVLTAVSLLSLITYVMVYNRLQPHSESLAKATIPNSKNKMLDGFMVLLVCFSLLHALSYLLLSGHAVALGLLLLVLLVAGLLISHTRNLLIFITMASAVTLIALALNDFSADAPQRIEPQMVGLLFIAVVLSISLHHLKRNLEQKLQRAAEGAALSHDSLLTTMRRSEERFKRLADATFEGVVFHDEGVILDANRRFGKIFGYEVEDLRGKKLLELIAPRARDVMQGRIERNIGLSSSQLSTVKEGDTLTELAQASDSYESFGWTQAKRVFPIDILERSLPLNDRLISVASVRDTTQVKENEGKMRSYEEELEQRNAELLRANKLKTSFLANMSHELRTPLTAINGFAELLKGEYFGELNKKQSQYVDDIYESGLHLLELINGILDLSKVEADKMTLRLQHTDLSAMVQEALKIVQAQAEAKGISLQVDSQSDTILLIDPIRIRQVLYNYLSNAVKFTPQGGDVTVHIFENEHAIITEVEDSGIGISASDQVKLFEPFVQLDNSTTRNQDGTGLGLALSRKLISMHGGEVWVRSEEGEGSVFGFSIPRSLAVVGNVVSEENTQITVPSSGSIHDVTQALQEDNDEATHDAEEREEAARIEAN